MDSLGNTEPHSPIHAAPPLPASPTSDVTRRNQHTMRCDTKPISEIIAQLSTMTLSESDIDASEDMTDIIQVERMTREEVLGHISDILKKCYFDENGYQFRLPSRQDKWQSYAEKLLRVVLMKNDPTENLMEDDSTENLMARTFTPSTFFGTAAQMVEILHIMKELLLKNESISKRALFYCCFPAHFTVQKTCDNRIEDIALLIGCQRNNLPIFAETRGKIGGKLSLSFKGEKYNCQVELGCSIPSRNFEKIQLVNLNAKFILVIEKLSVFNRLMDAKFYEILPCILITGSGQPDLATRVILRKMSLEFMIPVFALTDCDPEGFGIFMTYCVGSQNMSYDSANLVTPNIKWLGIHPSDIAMLKLPDYLVYKYTAKELASRSTPIWFNYVERDPELKKEYDGLDKKVEIESLNSLGMDFLSRYLLHKLGSVGEVKGEKDNQKELSNEIGGKMFPIVVQIENLVEFYKNKFGDSLDPIGCIHFTTEVQVEFEIVIYVPGIGPPDNVGPKTNNVRLFVKGRSFSDDINVELFPWYLSFVKCVINCDYLPPNLFKETFEKKRNIEKETMTKTLVSKTLKMIREICERENKEDYKKFWKNFGKFLKFECAKDTRNHFHLTPLLRFYSSKSNEEVTSLDSYVENMGKNEAIYYLAVDSLKSVKSALFLDKLIHKNIEVLYLIDPSDEAVIKNLQTYKGKKFVEISKEDQGLGNEVNESETKQEYNLLCDWVKQILGDKVAQVHISKQKLSSSSPCAVHQFGWSTNLQRLMKAQEREDTFSLEFMRLLEINPHHPIIKGLNDKCKKSPNSIFAKSVVDLLYETTLISSGHFDSLTTPGKQDI